MTETVKPILPGVEYVVDLLDQSTAEAQHSITAKIKVSPGDRMLMIGANGYGECLAPRNGGYPVIVEFYEGKFRVMIWGDINQEDPTHVISLEGAREDRYDEQVHIAQNEARGGIFTGHTVEYEAENPKVS